MKDSLVCPKWHCLNVPFVIVLNQLNDIAKIEQANEIKDRVIITLLKHLGILNPKFLCLSRSRGHWHYNIFFCPLWVTAKVCYL